MPGFATSNKDLVVSALQSAIDGDLEALLAALDPDVVVHEPPHLPYGGDYRGHDGFVQLQQRAAQILDVTSLTTAAATAGDERVVLLMTAGLVDGGEVVELTGHWVVRDGKIVDVKVFWFSTLPERES